LEKGSRPLFLPAAEEWSPFFHEKKGGKKLSTNQVSWFTLIRLWKKERGGGTRQQEGGGGGGGGCASLHLLAPTENRGSRPPKKKKKREREEKNPTNFYVINASSPRQKKGKASATKIIKRKNPVPAPIRQIQGKKRRGKGGRRGTLPSSFPFIPEGQKGGRNYHVFGEERGKKSSNQPPRPFLPPYIGKKIEKTGHSLGGEGERGPTIFLLAESSPRPRKKGGGGEGWFCLFFNQGNRGEGGLRTQEKKRGRAFTPFPVRASHRAEKGGRGQLLP